MNGHNEAPLYKYLKSQKGGGLFGDSIKWNFAKFLVDKNGKVVERYAPTTSPSKIEVISFKIHACFCRFVSSCCCIQFSSLNPKP